MRKIHKTPLAAAWLLFVLAFLTIMFSASFYLTAAFYRAAHLNLPALLVQIINSLLGLVFSGMIAGFAGRLANDMGWLPERNVFAPILEAMERIAKGDFRVRLENGRRDNQMVGKLVDSVNKMALELEHMENLRQEFISNVSHEIQSPLTSIHGFAQALENDGLSYEDRHHYLAIIQSESTRLSRITQDLLKLAALESEHPKFEPETYRLDKQIRSQVLNYEPQWSAKELDLVITLDAVEIVADQDLLSQVWSNLIHNSIKFTPQGGQICIELHRRGDQIEFKIGDTGIGIEPEDQPRIFERFYKADKSRSKTIGGSGLGLAIAKKIIDMHHGEIELASRPGSGTEITIRLSDSTKSIS